MFGFIGNIGPWELVFILLIALIVVGPGKLPEVAKSMGKGLNEFKKATSGVKKEFEDAVRLDDPSVVPKTETVKTNVEIVVDEVSENETTSADLLKNQE
ncbi:MAG: twin-arginine translocase TatA/TatE family subunit [Bacillota bacterium]|nr:twin-arginine translocase TatA/TatE family subunit [Bacillota bacterium]